MPHTESTTPGRRPKIKVLQVARGLAALAVVAYHLSELMSRELPILGRPFWDFVRHGHLGVQFFFALSGFIILYVHSVDVGNPRRLGAYVQKRFVRIYPLYWIVLVAVTIGILLKSAKGLNDLSKVSPWISQVTLLKLSTSRVVVGHAWTLFHEAFFYLLFALAIVSRRLGTAVLIAWLACILYWWEPQDHVHAVEDVLVGINNLFFFAGMAAFAMTSRLSARPAWCVFIAGTVLLLLGTATFDDPRVLKMSQTFFWIASFTLIVAGACALERTHQWKHVPRSAGFLGDASYSIYLTHWHCQTYALRALHKFPSLDKSSGPAVWLIVLMLSLGVGCIVYWFVERPLIAFFRRSMTVQADAHPTPAPIRACRHSQ